jgi:hypothetical protein
MRLARLPAWVDEMLMKFVLQTVNTSDEFGDPGVLDGYLKMNNSANIPNIDIRSAVNHNKDC